MPQGVIKRLTDKGFGFIKADREDLFFHHTEVKNAKYDELREGQTVEYEIGQGRKGPCAVNVRTVGR